jgi:DNA polymerase
MTRSPAVTPALLGKPVAGVPPGDLPALRRQARDCRACPLWKHATQTVFGAGPEDAQVMLIGEQPGHQEDLAGVPFVGPAGTLLDRALAEAGLARSSFYVTNTVKHFKYEMRGKVRLHKRASEAEQAACRKWLAAEITQVRPRILVALGAMAAQTLFGNAFRITRERGKWRTLTAEMRALATWHPSAILRAPPERRDELYGQLIEDLRQLQRS